MRLMYIMSDIIIVDDEPDICTLLEDILQDEGHTTRSTDNADSTFAEIDKKQPALIILDIWLQGSRMDGIEILKSVKKSHPEVPVVIISGHANIEIAVAAIKQGAYDFIQKPFQTEQLLITINRALEAHKLRKENQNLQSNRSISTDLIGKSPTICHIKSALNRIASASSRVMVSGGAGVGKERVARHLHAISNRAKDAFVTVSAASIEPARMEHVLFGEVRADGSYSTGLLEKADKGVLFIDEVSDMPLATQSKMLRVLLDQNFLPVGGTETINVDARIISATSKNIRHEIEQGTFREDLYHRLNVVPIEIPPLSERRDDIPLLVEYFVDEIGVTQGLNKRQFSSDAIALLQTYDWPGNIRQLRNLVEHVLILSSPTNQSLPVQANELPKDTTDIDPKTEQGNFLGSNVISLTLREAREAFERDYLLAQINRFSGNISRTASFIGMERSALHRKLKALGITPSGRANFDLEDTCNSNNNLA